MQRGRPLQARGATVVAMNTLAKAFELLPWPDWLALGLFFSGWVGYAVWAHRRAAVRPSLLALTNRERKRWMLQTSLRENRMLDGVVVQNLSTSPSFFASTTILIIGGLLAVLSTTERASELVREIPFAARTSVVVFDLKVALLTAIFVYAFFRFTWSMRQYTFGALMVAAAPERGAWTDEAQRNGFASRAGRMMAMAAETFNDGLRAYYFAFAALSWFISPWVFIVGTAGVVWILYRREFHSDVLAVLAEEPPPP
jgi:uncharacterized membrane protein